jgi:hypothetical protein
VDDEDTEVGPAPQPDTDRAIHAVMLADTDEWDDTDQAIEAQGTIDTTPAMFEDTGVVIVDKPTPSRTSERFAVTFREPSPVRLREPRARTQDEWPPPTRTPAAPKIRDRAFKHAAVYAVVGPKKN